MLITKSVVMRCIRAFVTILLPYMQITSYIVCSVSRNNPAKLITCAGILDLFHLAHRLDKLLNFCQARHSFSALRADNPLPAAAPARHIHPLPLAVPQGCLLPGWAECISWNPFGDHHDARASSCEELRGQCHRAVFHRLLGEAPSLSSAPPACALWSPTPLRTQSWALYCFTFPFQSVEKVGELNNRTTEPVPVVLRQRHRLHSK